MASDQYLIGFVGLARLMESAGGLQVVGPQMESRVVRNPMDANALLDLSTLLFFTANPDMRKFAIEYQRRALEFRQIYHLAPPAKPTSLELLVLMAPGDMTSNTPVDCLLEGADINVTLLYVLPDRPLPSPLPDHDVIFVAIGESSANQILLRQLGELPALSAKPVVNLPDRIALLTRDRVSELLRSVPGTVMPATVVAKREDLVKVHRGEMSLDEIMAGGRFPIIARPPDSQGGKGLLRIDNQTELKAYVEGLPSAEFYISNFIDYRSPDGQYKKYRIVFVGERPFGCHLAISSNWMVHYVNANMDESATKRREEEQFFADFEHAFAVRHRQSLAAIHDRLGLDYLTIDCAETPDGKLLIFEADNAAIVHDFDDPAMYPYKPPAMRRIFSAFRELLVAQACARDEEAPPSTLDSLRDVVFSNPGSYQAHYNLANALREQGNIAEAVESCRKALALKPDLVEAHINLGAMLQRLGLLDDAAASSRTAISLRPDLAVAHFNLGSVLRDLDHSEAAIASYRRAISLKPDYALAHLSLGNALSEKGHLDAALQSYRAALSVQPDLAEAHSNLGLVLQARGLWQEAAESYRRATSLEPNFAIAHNNLGVALKELGQTEAALVSYQRALELADTAEIKANFVLCIKDHVFRRSDESIRRLVARAISEAWAWKSELAGASASLIRVTPAIRECLARAERAWPRLLPSAELFGPTGLAAMASDPVLRAALEAFPVCDVGLERCLTMVRRAMLESALEPNSGEGTANAVLTFYCSVARQCFINEYVFFETREEAASAALLRQRAIASLESGRAIPLSWIPALGAYFPLQSIAGMSALPRDSFPESIAALLTQQIDEPLQEAQLRTSIEQLTSIGVGVSSSVRRQYEENPYPRWMKLPPAGTARSFDDYLRRQFPSVPIRPLAKAEPLQMLIAGCGTGAEAIEAAQDLPHSQILAIDLSLSSLAYAVRKSRESGVENIKYLQADILEVRKIDRTFDVISSSGVLHHLADPLAGLRELLSLLRPGGFMRLGLYSEAARRVVVETRQFIAERGYASTPEDIRRCRQDLIAIGARFAPLKKFGDFYATSECRDLLFHVQEHRFTVPGIKAALQQAGLQFIGFVLDSNVNKDYAERYPDDLTRTNLDNWHLYETGFPDTFAGMYKFWVQKPGPFENVVGIPTR